MWRNPVKKYLDENVTFYRQQPKLLLWIILFFEIFHKHSAIGWHLQTFLKTLNKVQVFTDSNPSWERERETFIFKNDFNSVWRRISVLCQVLQSDKTCQIGLCEVNGLPTLLTPMESRMTNKISITVNISKIKVSCWFKTFKIHLAECFKYLN